MSTVDSPTLDQVLAALQSWQEKSPSEVDKVEFFEIAIRDLQSSHNQAALIGEFDNLGEDAVRNDAAFLAVTNCFIELILKYLDPELLKLAEEWNTYRSRWLQLFKDSGEMASQSALSYRRYDMFLLQAVQDVETVEDIKRVAAQLEQFSQENPVDIPMDLANQFLLLKRDMGEFESKIDDFVRRKGLKASEVAVKLMEEISILQSEIDRFSDKINNFTFLLGLTSLIGIMANAFPGTGIYVLGIQLSEKNDEKKQKILALAEVKQNEDFLRLQRLVHGVDEHVFQTLSELTNVWAKFHGQALQFAHVLNSLPNAEIPKQFAREVELARELAGPLTTSLDRYAQIVRNHFSRSQDAPEHVRNETH